MLDYKQQVVEFFNCRTAYNRQGLKHPAKLISYRCLVKLLRAEVARMMTLENYPEEI